MFRFVESTWGDYVDKSIYLAVTTAQVHRQSGAMTRELGGDFNLRESTVASSSGLIQWHTIHCIYDQTCLIRVLRKGKAVLCN